MKQPRIVVIGAGVIGAWTAWQLRQRHAEVLLVDAWGPANTRSSSGDETRILRFVYGNRPHYIELTNRSLSLWKKLQALSGVRLYTPAGALWLFGEDDRFARDSIPHLERLGVPLEKLEISNAAKRYPQVRWDDVRQAYLDLKAGYLMARRSVQAVVAQFESEGGALRVAAAQPVFSKNGSLERVCIGDNDTVEGDFYVFACGPWLGRLFPEWIGPWLRPSRQEVFYFGPPAGDMSFSDTALPAWLDEARGSWYGIPGNEGRGFKISCNELGETVDPSTLDRTHSPERLARAREHIAFRFPRLAGAPLLESRVCQYENTPDHELLVDRHPGDPRVFIVGGGSGHAFKMAPALGELMTRMLLEQQHPPPQFGISRFSSGPATAATPA